MYLSSEKPLQGEFNTLLYCIVLYCIVTNMLLINGWNTLQNAFIIGLNWETNYSVSLKLGIDLHVKVRS